MSTKNNHYVTQAFSDNFRSNPGNPFYVFDCKTGSIQSKGLKTLFMKRHAWGDDLERSFGDLENEVMPAIKTILFTPFASFPENIDVHCFRSKGCSIISRYFNQNLMLQLANEQHPAKQQELLVSELLKSNCLEFGNFATYIRYNPRTFKDHPFALFDNVASFYLAPVPDERQPTKASSYKLCLTLAISEYSLLFFGNAAYVERFLIRFSNPHIFNIYRIIQENRECKLASQNREYLQFLAKEHQYYSATNETAYAYTVRSFIKPESHVENALQ